MGSIPLFTLADIINWGWLRIGPPYVYINIDPVIVHLGPLALHWYGLMYVVGIVIALWGIRGYLKRKSLSEDVVYRVLWWCIVAGLVGGRLYFVIQQPDLVQHYILQPWRILATWEGGMAFYGAIFLVVPVLFWRAWAERVNPLVALDAGVMFAAIGQIFGRIGNLINGDIIGYPSTLPWSTVYQHPASYACQNGLCGVPVQPAAAYEMLCNIALLIVMYILSRRLRRPGVLTLVYLFGYAITQFLIFFTRANEIVDFLGTHILKQAQWTSIIVFIVLIPVSFLVLRMRYARPVPEGEPAATYGIPQKPKERSVLIEQPLRSLPDDAEQDSDHTVQPANEAEDEARQDEQPSADLQKAPTGSDGAAPEQAETGSASSEASSREEPEKEPLAVDGNRAAEDAQEKPEE